MDNLLKGKMGKFSYLTGDKILSLVVLVGMLSLGIGNNPGWSFGCNNIGKTYAFRDPQSTLTSLETLGWLEYLTASDQFSCGTETANLPSENSSKETITSRIETVHGSIYGYKGEKIPPYLVANFDRIFQMVASYFNVEADNEKMVVWAVDFDTLQEIYPGQKNYPGGSPNTVAALYAPRFNYFFFTPRYMNDYYVTHELIHYFVDEYQEEAISGLPQVITQRSTTDLPIGDFISQHEEEIAIELSQIMIRQNLASFALQGIQK